ncbi:hypothetical protein [Roseomonas sp. BN140053]|uniref:hypothetical protein n=1 Tax=Roseomonas sp. BN140053 TaxID=3391898 RepID=UPI0039EAED2A
MMRSNATTTGNKRTGGGKFSVKVISGSGGFEDVEGSEERESAERVYDPLWANALTLLEFLTDKGFMRRGLIDAKIGDVVLVTGQLIVADMALVKTLYAIPEVRENFIKSTLASTPAEAAGDDPQRNAEVVFKIVSQLPYGTQARVITVDRQVVWAPLRSEALVTSATDLALSHGLRVAGTWAMLGILDALPEHETPFEAEAPQPDAITEYGLLGGPQIRDLLLISPNLRSLGRPFHAYGMTPILIFREVQPVSA